MKVGIEKPALYRVEERHLVPPRQLRPLVPERARDAGRAGRQGSLLYVWRRFGWVAAAWAAIVPVCLVAASWHVPSDVAGGVLFGLLSVLRAYAAIAKLERPAHLMDAADVAALLVRVEAGELGDPLPVLAYVAGQRVELPEQELSRARRRALLVLAAGGDPHRELEVDAPAVKSLAADLFDDARRAQLAGGIDELVVAARELPRTRDGRALPRRRRRSRLAAARARAAGRGARRRRCFVRGIARPRGPCRCVPEVRHFDRVTRGICGTHRVVRARRRGRRDRGAVRGRISADRPERASASR